MSRVVAPLARTASRALLGVLLLAAIVMIGLVPGAAPASAHDQLVASDPVDGAQLPASPPAITLTFSSPPVAVEPQIVVTDSAGTRVASGSPTVEGSLVSLAIGSPLPNGAYQVSWRVVSADGHPIEGTLGFTVAAPPQVTPEAVPGVAASPEPTATGPLSTDLSGSPGTDATEPGAAAADTPTTPAGATAPTAPGAESSATLMIVILGIVAVAGVLVVVVLVLRRRLRDDAARSEVERP